MIKICKECKHEFKAKENKAKFCNLKCFGKYNSKINTNLKIKKKKIKLCLFCKNILKNNSSTYCNNTCNNLYKYNLKLELFNNGDQIFTGVRTLKRFIISNEGYHCKKCGISKWNGEELVLQLEHINGNADDNKKSNLCLLCPNCHSQTDSYAGRNSGKGLSLKRNKYKYKST